MLKKTTYLFALALALALGMGASAAERGVVDVRTVLNVRAAPSVNAAVTDRLAGGETVTLHARSGDWWYAEYASGVYGYLHADYVRTLGEGAVSLSVPTLRQTDRAYASLRLPGSRERISTHGCAVTSLAMVESYRTGRAITPKSVLATERFTKTGAIYWPSRYKKDGATLANILDALHCGSPVIVHAKKKNGQSHFAVVNGFTGGALTAANFTLLDPGSASRKTLADLYAVYPVAVKILAY